MINLIFSVWSDALVIGLLSSTYIISPESAASATPNTGSSTDVNGVSITSGYSNPELAADSGDILYVENRSPITRASDQTENIKLIIEF